jgi:hypothetical protein
MPQTPAKEHDIADPEARLTRRGKLSAAGTISRRTGKNQGLTMGGTRRHLIKIRP